MEVTNKPISYTAARLLVHIWKESPFDTSNCFHLPSGEKKRKLAQKLGLTEKALNNVITELVVTHYLTRIKRTYFITKEEYVEKVNGVYKVKSYYEFRD